MTEKKENELKLSRNLFEREPVPDALAVKQNLGEVTPKKSNSDDKEEFEYAREIFEKENEFLLGLSLYVLEKLDSQIKSARKNGLKETTIDAALKNMLKGENELEFGHGLHPDKAINLLVLAKTLSELGAKQSEISTSWVLRKIKELRELNVQVPSETQIELYFKHKYPNLLRLPMDILMKDSIRSRPISFDVKMRLEDRIGHIAELAYNLDRVGVGAMGHYAFGTNDCFDFCMLVLAQARGPGYFRFYTGHYKRDSQRTIENERVNGTVEYKWTWPKKWKESIDEIKKMDGCIVQTHSWNGSGKGEHWGVYYKGYVYHFTGDKLGIMKTPIEEFAGEQHGKKILLAIRPLERKNVLKTEL